MFVEAISEKAAVVNWVENFLKNQPVFFKDEKWLPKLKTGIPFTKKEVDDSFPVFTITKDDCEIHLTLFFREKGVSLVFSDYKIRRIKKAEEALESYFESGDTDFEFRKLKEKINVLSKDLSKALNMKKEDWKRREVVEG